MDYLAQFFNLSKAEIVFILLLVLALLFLIFLLIREFWCWYFKTTEISYFLEEISEKLSEQNKLHSKIYNQLLEINKVSEVKVKKPHVEAAKSVPETGWEFAEEECGDEPGQAQE